MPLHDPDGRLLRIPARVLIPFAVAGIGCVDATPPPRWPQPPPPVAAEPVAGTMTAPARGSSQPAAAPDTVAAPDTGAAGHASAEPEAVPEPDAFAGPQAFAETPLVPGQEPTP